MVLMLVYFAISSKKSTHDLFSSIFLMLFFVEPIFLML
jgi:hypothetical protein